MKFKKALFGYNPKTINELIETIEIQHVREVKQLKKDLTLLMSEIGELEAKLQELKTKSDIQSKYEAEIGKTLYDTCVETSRELCYAMEKAEKTEQEKLEIVSAYEVKLVMLQNNFKHITEIIKSRIAN